MLTFNQSSVAMIPDGENIAYKYCKNYEYGVCNWVVEQNDPHEYCLACQLNRTIPDLSDEANFQKWQQLELAKHRLIYQLLKMGQFLQSKHDAETGLCFDFRAKQNNPEVMTGHINGVITILISEADSVIREHNRVVLDEPYRTLIGHLRHEVGHYFWERLIYNNEQLLFSFRQLFGDDRVDYNAALDSYYKYGAPTHWQDSFISRYATAHPWEDWAETWAHYLHIMDMVETAYFFGMKVQTADNLTGMNTAVTIDPYATADFQVIFETCVPLSFAVNSINRAVGLPDVYPFVIANPVLNKMKFIHSVLFRFGM